MITFRDVRPRFAGSAKALMTGELGELAQCVPAGWGRTTLDTHPMDFLA